MSYDDDFVYDDDEWWDTDDSERDDDPSPPVKRWQRGRPKSKGKNAPGKQLSKKGVPPPTRATAHSRELVTDEIVNGDPSEIVAGSENTATAVAETRCCRVRGPPPQRVVWEDQIP